MSNLGSVSYALKIESWVGSDICLRLLHFVHRVVSFVEFLCGVAMFWLTQQITYPIWNEHITMAIADAAKRTVPIFLKHIIG